MTKLIVPPPTSTDLELKPELKTDERRIRRAGIPENTRRAYAADWRIFLEWCSASGRSPLPATIETVCGFLTERATGIFPKGRGLAPGPDSFPTLARRLSAISVRHRRAGHVSPWEDESVRELLAALKRNASIRGERTKKAAPLLADTLVKICTVPGLPAQDRAVLLLGWAGAMRRSEIYGLDVGDVEDAGAGLKVTLRVSKTGVGEFVIIEPGAHDLSCPVKAFQRWMDLRRSGRIEAPSLFYTSKGGRLNGDDITAIIRRGVASVGVDATGYSGHSLRAGYITQATLSGVPEWEIRKQSRHRSEKEFQAYVRPVHDAARGTVKKMGL